MLRELDAKEILRDCILDCVLPDISQKLFQTALNFCPASATAENFFKNWASKGSQWMPRRNCVLDPDPDLCFKKDGTREKFCNKEKQAMYIRKGSKYITAQWSWAEWEFLLCQRAVRALPPLQLALCRRRAEDEFCEKMTIGPFEVCSLTAIEIDLSVMPPHTQALLFWLHKDKQIEELPPQEREAKARLLMSRMHLHMLMLLFCGP
jgi:hypothetical protein